MTQNFWRLISVAAISTALAAPLAQAATVIDFESDALTGLYFAGDSFSQDDFTLTAKLSYGVIDTAAALGTQSPTGNLTQFYFNANNGALGLARSDGGLFSLSGFAAAFVALDPAPLQTTVIMATGIKADNSVVSSYWAFAPSMTSHFAFSSYASAADFAAFSSVKEVEFHACSLVGSVICSEPLQNNGQFAIDDILVTSVTAVPEPATTLLMTLGLLALGLRARRATP